MSRVAGVIGGIATSSTRTSYLNCPSHVRRARWLPGSIERRTKIFTSVHISTMTPGELQAGVEITREQDPNKAAEIDAWIDLVAQTWNVLPAGARAFRSWAKLMHRRPEHLIEDALIAATAVVHHLTVVTRNTRDFAIFQVATFNPFKTA